MNTFRSRHLDLNLLHVFRALYETRHLTRAAEKLKLTQSAMSHALARLRSTLDDQLFTKTPRGMSPTAYADQMAPGIESALRGLEDALSLERTFEPKTSTARIRIATTDYVEEMLWGVFAKKIRAAAPNMTIETHQLKERVPLREIEGGAIDIAIGSFPVAPKSLRTQVLIREEFMVLMGKGHPAAKGTLTLEQYAELPHMLVAPWGMVRGIVDDVLEKKGLSRHIAMTVANFSSVPQILDSSDLVATLPAKLAKRWQSRFGIVTVAPPTAIPGFKINLLWHERVHQDKAQQFVRGLLKSCAEDV